MSNILIIGGAGYIGSHVNKLLAGSGRRTVVFDNLSCGHKKMVRWGDFFKGDLSRKSDLLRCFKTCRISAVMHFAAFTAVGESVSDPEKFYFNNVANTINLLSAMRVSGVEKLIFSSSAAVYGKPEKAPISEGGKLLPLNPYGRTKLMMEQVMADYADAYGLEYAALRYFNAAGADPEGEIGELHEPETHLVPLAIQAAIGRRGALKVFGEDYPTPDGTCIRDYVHVWDLAQAHLLALRYLEKGNKSMVFNLGNGRGFSVLEIIRVVERVSGRKVPVVISPRRAGDPPVLVASSVRARRILRWRPRFSKIEDIVQHAWNWHKHNYL